MKEKNNNVLEEKDKIMSPGKINDCEINSDNGS